MFLLPPSVGSKLYRLRHFLPFSDSKLKPQSGRLRAVKTSVQSNSLANEQPYDLGIHPSERRKHPRFDMRVPVFLRGLGEPWVVSETADVSGAGASFVSGHRFPLNTPLEYVLTFPPDLTKAPQPLRVRFFGTVIRCERMPESQDTFGIAVRNTAHRYLSHAEASGFSAMDEEPSASVLPPLATGE